MTGQAEIGPIDEERYLRLLFHSVVTMPYARSFVLGMKQLDFDARVADAIAAGATTPERRDYMRRMYEEVSSLEYSFRQGLISEIRESALVVCGADRQRVEGIPVCLLPVGTLNGAIFMTPYGGAVIVLNHAVTALLPFIIRCVWAIASWNAGQPHDREVSRNAYAGALSGVAQVARTGDVGQLRRYMGALGSYNPFDPTGIALTYTIEQFILLHEYGHFLRGHLDRSPPGTRTASHMNQYLGSTPDEFEADEYAVQRLLESGKSQEEIAMATGFLMRFFGLCELLAILEHPTRALSAATTHPTALARWERIKRLTDVNGRKSFSLYIDGLFSYIVAHAGMGVLHDKLVLLARRT